MGFPGFDNVERVFPTSGRGKPLRRCVDTEKIIRW
jgi:hypothetical protein